jgi:hypothetical protein
MVFDFQYFGVREICPRGVAPVPLLSPRRQGFRMEQIPIAWTNSTDI